MNYLIRPLQAEDYPEVTEIYNSQNEPHHHLSVEELRRSDERAQNSYYHRLLVAVEDGKVIATGQFGERPGDNPPGKFWAWFHVREDRRGQGVDTALYDAALEVLAVREPRNLWACIREDFVPAAGYLSDRSYEEQFRSWGANLDLAGFKPSAFGSYTEVVAQQGIELRKYADLDADPVRDEKLAVLQSELEDDAPHHEPIIPKRHPTPQHLRMLLDSLVVAVHEGQYVGMASLIGQPRFPEVPGSGLVGVKREFRSRGVGTALVASTSAWAKAHGYEEVNAGGAGLNTPMLKVIRRIGFDVEPAWITFARFL